MKLPVSICVLLVAVSAQLMAEQPYEIRRLLEQREAAIKKVNITAAKELEQLKKGYMKKGDLVAANRAENLRQKVSFGKAGSLVSKSSFDKEVVGKKWQWRHKRDKRSWFTLKSDGTAVISWHKKGNCRWVKYENRTVAVLFQDHMAILSWESDYSSFKGYQKGSHVKLYGKKIE